ncbi:cell death regulator Aven isoform X3 [Pseudophryne corroboree]|uniref:cell death regulator Aven isoform X3 n=1 Tax=Pseudophryne corroboree TaxID=495146 RepID=UPI00308145A7
MERGRGRYRRGGGGGRRPHRSRGSGGDREFVHRGHRGGARDRTGPRENEEQAVDVVDPGEEKEDQSSGFSRRKILSNWDRYKAAEKEKENEVLQRGTDYSVLLSSAGDAFTQFRFADEREWAAEKLSTTQEELPQELPPFMLKGNPNMAPTFTAQIITGSTVASDQAAASLPEPQTPQNPSLPALDEELDFLLSLDAPIREERAASPGVTKQHDEQVTCEEHAISPMTDHAGSDALEAHKAVTSEDLEDWLDSMIG